MTVNLHELNSNQRLGCFDIDNSKFKWGSVIVIQSYEGTEWNGLDASLIIKSLDYFNVFGFALYLFISSFLFIS